MPPINIDRTIASWLQRGDNTDDFVQHASETATDRYIDGSVFNQGVGFGVCGPNMDKLETYLTNFIAATLPAKMPIVVFTDFVSAISALKSETLKYLWIQGILSDMILGTTFAWTTAALGGISKPMPWPVSDTRDYATPAPTHWPTLRDGRRASSARTGSLEQ